MANKVFRLLCVGQGIPRVERYVRDRPGSDAHALARFLVEECATGPVYALLDEIVAELPVERDDLLDVLHKVARR